MSVSDVSKRRLIYLGAGPYPYAMFDCLGSRDGRPYELAGFVQNLDVNRRGETFEGYPVHWVEDLAPLVSTHDFVCPVADPAAKKKFVEQVKPYGVRFPTVAGELTHISTRSEIGEGLCLSRLSTICSHCRIGRHLTVMISVVISDEVVIGDYVFIGAGTKTGGGVEIGDGSFIGLNSAIRDHVKIGKNVTVGTGSVVVKDVPDGVTVVGNPARIVEPRGELFKK